MNKVYMKIKDDCLRACVATYLGLPYDEVPHFDHNGKQRRALNKFLATKGLVSIAVTFEFDEFDHEDAGVMRNACFIATVPSLITDKSHAVIVNIKGELVFDPLKGNRDFDYDDIESIDLICKLVTD